MSETAAECAADADWIVGDMRHNIGQEGSERAANDASMKGGMPHAGADRQSISFSAHIIESGNIIDIDEMGRTRQAEGHGRNEALAAREDSTVKRRQLCQ